MKKIINQESIYKIITKADYKITRPRAKLIKTLLNNKEYLTASQIIKKIPDSNVASIYNNIWLLEKLKIVDKITYKSKSYYQIPFDPNEHNKDFTGFYINKSNKITAFDIQEEAELLKSKLQGEKISKIKIYVSEK